MCVSVPYLREVVSVCLDFVNMTYSLTEISGCVFVEARYALAAHRGGDAASARISHARSLLGVSLGKYKLGCFDLKMPTPGAQHMSLSAGERPMQVVDGHPLALAPLLGDDKDAELEPLTGCDCHGHSCACCATASWRHKKHSACLNITYSPSHLSVSLLFTVDGRVAYNDTVGVADLGSICFGIPFIDKLLSVCLEFAGISYSKVGLFVGPHTFVHLTIVRSRTCRAASIWRPRCSARTWATSSWDASTSPRWLCLLVPDAY